MSICNHSFNIYNHSLSCINYSFHFTYKKLSVPNCLKTGKPIQRSRGYMLVRSLSSKIAIARAEIFS
ncbi:MAG: hypothetical protein V7K54_06415 [Nostoc sp.]